MSTLNVNRIVDASGGVFAPVSSVMRNRIINGDCRIDQRNAGASGTANGYTTDRWSYFGTQSSKLTWQQNAGSVTPPAGFTRYLGFTSSSAYSVVAGDIFAVFQRIEGLNVADLGWGTANAKTVTLSAWVRSSLTGTFGGSLMNGSSNRAYPFTFTIASANTWTQISVTIAGDTSGTWATDNSSGLQVIFNLGSGSTFTGTAGSWSANNFYSATGSTNLIATNGATFYITGVQLEVGTQATSFEYRQYQQELALCQRYYNRWSGANSPYIGLAQAVATGSNAPVARRFSWANPVDFRTSPTMGFGGTIQIYTAGLSNLAFTGFNGSQSNKNIISFDANSTSSGTSGQSVMLIIDSNSASNFIDASAEL